jgi:hypothetical protein
MEDKLTTSQTKADITEILAGFAKRLPDCYEYVSMGDSHAVKRLYAEAVTSILAFIAEQVAEAHIEEAQYIKEHADYSIISDAWSAYDNWLEDRIASLQSTTKAPDA